MDKVLFINACVRECSRTLALTEILLEKLSGDVQEVCLQKMSLPTLDLKGMEQRHLAAQNQDFSNPSFDLAKQFSVADIVVIAAPYWDFSFPAVLKQYIEQINVTGVTFSYTLEGIPQGLCRAKKLYYVMTAGGMYVPEEYGFGYIRALAQNFYGIDDVELIKAVGLDIYGADEEKILQEVQGTM